MNKKRRSEQAGQEELEKTMFSTFTNAANSLSHLYMQAYNNQKSTFKAGQQYGLEKLKEWILRQVEEGGQVTQEEIIAYLQDELNDGEVIPMSPVSQPERENSPFQIPHGRVEAAVAAEDQNRNTIFLNALSSPIRGSLQPPHMSHGGNVSDELNIARTGRGSPSHVSNAMEE